VISHDRPQDSQTPERDRAQLAGFVLRQLASAASNQRMPTPQEVRWAATLRLHQGPLPVQAQAVNARCCAIGAPSTRRPATGRPAFTDEIDPLLERAPERCNLGLERLTRLSLAGSVALGCGRPAVRCRGIERVAGLKALDCGRPAVRCRGIERVAGLKALNCGRPAVRCRGIERVAGLKALDCGRPAVRCRGIERRPARGPIAEGRRARHGRLETKAAGRRSGVNARCSTFLSLGA
jgi:hypothetical protein